MNKYRSSTQKTKTAGNKLKIHAAFGGHCYLGAKCNGGKNWVYKAAEKIGIRAFVVRIVATK